MMICDISQMYLPSS